MRQEIHRQLAADVVALAERAGAAILEIYRAGAITFTAKDDDSPLTLADLRAHGMLLDGLARLTPGWPVVSEEDSGRVLARPIPGRFWLLDPLDGTKEFLSGSDEFTVNVALIVDGKPVFGVVVAPALALTYWGLAPGTAFRVDTTGVTAIRASAWQAGQALRVVASKSHMNAQTQSFIGKLGACQLLQAGSSLKICRGAEGAADLYPRLGPTCEWDTAAAHAVLEAAGGTLRTPAGDSLRYGKPDVLNPFFIAAASGWPAAWPDC